MDIILKDKTYYEVPQEKLIYWTGIFQNVDVYQEVMVMASWSLANPSKCKTKAGIERFINAWLSKANEKGKSIEVPTQDSLADVSWVRDPALRVQCQDMFLQKYGFYYFNGNRISAGEDSGRITEGRNQITHQG